MRHSETDLASCLHSAVKHTPNPPMWSNICVGVQPEQNKPVSKCRQTFPVKCFLPSNTFSSFHFTFLQMSLFAFCLLMSFSCIWELNLLIWFNNPKQFKWVMHLICILFLLSLKCGFETPCSGFMWLHSVICARLLKHRLALLGVA